MKLEVLLATMNQVDDSILDTMNVSTDIIVCNQNENCVSYKCYERNEHNVRWYNFSEKGVGLNRNNALLRATADICVLADDDIIYNENYDQIIINAFKLRPDVDILLFNIHSLPNEKRYIATKDKRIHRYNCGKFGAVRIAFRRMSVIKNAVSFNQLFGGGSIFAAGEDTMFIRDCIRKGLKVVAVSDFILKLNDLRPSTWFRGYDQKYFEDMGSSYYYHFKSLANLCVMLQLFKRRKAILENYSFVQAWRFAKIGIRKFKEMK